jgi:hypothetical protein
MLFADDVGTKMLYQTRLRNLAFDPAHPAKGYWMP